MVLIFTVFVFSSCGSKENVEDTVKTQPQPVETGTEDETPVETEDETTESSTRNSGYYGYGYSSAQNQNEEEAVEETDDSAAKDDAAAEQKEEPKEESLLDNPSVRYGAIGGLALVIILAVFFIFKPKS